MSFLEEINNAVSPTGIPIETGVFSGKPPEEYIVVTPMNDNFDLFADNKPKMTISEARLSLFKKGNYVLRKNQITKELLRNGFTITDRHYVGYEEDTKYHHYAIDIEKEYEEEE